MQIFILLRPFLLCVFLDTCFVVGFRFCGLCFAVIARAHVHPVCYFSHGSCHGLVNSIVRDCYSCCICLYCYVSTSTLFRTNAWVDNLLVLLEFISKFPLFLYAFRLYFQCHVCRPSLLSVSKDTAERQINQLAHIFKHRLDESSFLGQPGVWRCKVTARHHLILQPTHHNM